MASDQQLLERWRQGDAASGEALFDRHFLSVSRFFRTKVPSQAEDLIQQTFLACVEGQERLGDPKAFKAYLFGIARNVLRRHLRGGGREVDLAQSSIEDLQPGPSTILGAHRQQRRILEALRKIPLDLQIALELFYWEELEAKDIAKILDIPEGTVRSRIRRGKEMVERKLAAFPSGARLESTEASLGQWAKQLREALDEDG